MTQKEMILKHLQMFGSITPFKALEEYGVYRLSAVIFDLRADKVNIDTNYITRKNRFGKNVTFAEYILKKGE